MLRSVLYSRYHLGSALTFGIASSLRAAEDDALLKDARSIFAALPANFATAQRPITPARVELGRALFFDPRRRRSQTTHQGPERQARGTENPRAPVPLLRRPNAHHRDLPARAAAKKSSHAGSAEDQDRYIIRPLPTLAAYTELHQLCWFSADNVGDRTFNPISAMRTTPKLTIEASRSPVAPSPPKSGAWHLAISRALPHRFISSTPEPAAKSP
jgi:hypothetical protein